MLSEVFIAARSLAVFTALTGAVYPLAVYGVGRAAFPDAAGGSLVRRGGKIVGSALIAQKAPSDRYFRARPSAADYATVASGASNLAPTSAALKDAVAKRQAELGPGAPPDLLFASGSGLDPHVSPAAARFQAAKVGDARALTPAKRKELDSLVERAVEAPQLGILGMPRVNVLLLNLALDERFP